MGPKVRMEDFESKIAYLPVANLNDSSTSGGGLWNRKFSEQNKHTMGL